LIPHKSTHMKKFPFCLKCGFKSVNLCNVLLCMLHILAIPNPPTISCVPIMHIYHRRLHHRKCRKPVTSCFAKQFNILHYYRAHMYIYLPLLSVYIYIYPLEEHQDQKNNSQLYTHSTYVQLNFESEQCCIKLL